MCGIVGQVNLQGLGFTDPAKLLEAQRLLRHRGPDASGTWSDWKNHWFGHLRLSIIDLSDAASQPLSNEDHSVRVVFNGEIYNYRELMNELRSAGHVFRSGSDTEVLVHGYEEWGLDELLRRIRGMFAFALSDVRCEDGRRSPKVYLVRDRLGIKPLYYSVVDGRLSFASEAKALVRSGIVQGRVDQRALAGFLCFGAVPAPRTIWHGVRCLSAGHYLSVNGSEVAEKCYWELPPEVRSDEISRVSDILTGAVEEHLVADVPVGVFLSGGVDSSAIAAVASKYHKRLKTLTVAFEEREFNEGSAAREFAEAFGTEHREVVVGANEFRGEIPRILASMDQPTADGVNTYFVSRAAKQAGLKVVLSGLGGDEVFWGYPHYHRLYRSRVANVYGSLPGGFRRMVDRGLTIYGGVRGQERWRRFGYCGDGHLNEGLYLVSRGFFPPDDVARLLDGDVKQVEDVVEETLAPLRRPAGKSDVDLEEICRLEFQRYLHDQLLRDSDVFSMTHSIELRVPYLDHRLVEASWKIPAERKIQYGINKPVLVEAVGHSLVERAARRTKRGFTFPFAKWLARDAGALQENALGSGPLNRRAVEGIWSAFNRGRLHWSRAWSTVVLNAICAEK